MSSASGTCEVCHKITRPNARGILYPSCWDCKQKALEVCPGCSRRNRDPRFETCWACKEPSFERCPGCGKRRRNPGYELCFRCGRDAFTSANLARLAEAEDAAAAASDLADAFAPSDL